MPRNVNDWLALALVILVIPGLWLLQGAHIIALPDAALGATILQWGLILQFYFRKQPPTGGGKTS